MKDTGFVVNTDGSQKEIVDLKEYQWWQVFKLRSL